MDLILPCNDTSHLPLRFKDEKKKTILHYSHRHELSFFKYRKVREEGYDCYGVKNIYCHQKCAMVVDIASSISISDKCNACSNWCRFGIPLYVCEMCSFRLDFDCAKLSPSLKLDCHHHLLTFFKDFKKGE
ncbi:hypothetical protein Goklo_021487 [Gossypium klotzschianum]|nr:hypothetical protein [Gossypium klotzschianum]